MLNGRRSGGRRVMSCRRRRPPLVGRLEAGDDPEQRGLPAPARAEQAEERARGDIEIDALQRDDVAEALRDPRMLTSPVAVMPPSRAPRPALGRLAAMPVAAATGAPVPTATHGTSSRIVATAFTDGSIVRSEPRQHEQRQRLAWSPT